MITNICKELIESKDFAASKINHGNSPGQRNRNVERAAKAILSGLLLSAFFLTGCATPIYVDYDREATSKIRNYKCFVVDTSESKSHSGSLTFSPIADRCFTHELSAALKARGYTKDCSEPDFRIRLDIAKETITQLDFVHPSNSSPSFGNHSFHPQIGYFPPPHIDRFEQGTFLIDIVDVQSEKIVWSGIYAERIGRRPHKDEEIRFIIDSILERFPPQSEYPGALRSSAACQWKRLENLCGMRTCDTL